MTDSLVIELLTQIREELRGLRLSQATSVKRLSDADRNTLRYLLPVISEAVRAETFCISDLRANAAFTRPVSVALREALAVVGDTKRLGRILKRGTGHVIDGYRVELIGRERDGIVWRLYCDDQSLQTIAKTRNASDESSCGSF